MLSMIFVGSAHLGLPVAEAQSVRVEQRRNGEVVVRFEAKYLTVSECAAPAAKTAQPKASLTRARSGPAQTTCGKSQWMKRFWDRKAPSLKQAITISNATS